MVQVLTDLDLIISKSYISSDGGWFMDGQCLSFLEWNSFNIVYLYFSINHDNDNWAIYHLKKAYFYLVFGPIIMTTTLSYDISKILVVRFWYKLCGACLFLLHNAVFHVTDQAGKKLTDRNLMHQIEKVFLSLPIVKYFVPYFLLNVYLVSNVCPCHTLILTYVITVNYIIFSNNYWF